MRRIAVDTLARGAIEMDFGGAIAMLLEDASGSIDDRPNAASGGIDG